MTFYPSAGVAAGYLESLTDYRTGSSTCRTRCRSCRWPSNPPCCSHMTFYLGVGVAARNRISDGLQAQVRAEPAAGAAAGCQSHSVAHT
jgi:hypothetical protein